ncbi:LamG domain-containing protein [Hymenobacter koreensis]|uniref:Laminin G domain-containing protein n=1 Tax=Hymenobacter koreensis TaxID=1084523 RepID=A0ABP8JL48_9BACT
MNTRQSWDGDNLELYLKIIASTAGGTIRVIKRIGITRDGTIARSNPRGWHHSTGGVNFGNVSPSFADVKPHLLHFAYQAREFARWELGNNFPLPTASSQPLVIMLTPPSPFGSPPFEGNPESAFFAPGGYRNPLANVLMPILGIASTAYMLTFLSNEDCLYIGEDNETEETVYHEFGHYLMWHLQRRSWSHPIEAGFVSHSSRRNDSNPRLAWTEGWATGFAMIMDAYTVRYDGEREVDDNNDQFEERLFAPIQRLLPELRRQNVRRNGIINLENTLTHGFLSEFNIAAALYDLWDGQANLALQPGAPPAAGPNPAKDFEDRLAPGNPNSPVRDRVSLSFDQLCAPVRTHFGNGIWGIGLFSPQVTQHAMQYHRFLLELTADCDQRRLITEVFTLNRVSNFETVLNPVPPAPTQTLSSDSVIVRTTVDEPLFKAENGAFEPDGRVQFSAWTDPGELTGAGTRFNLAAPAANGAGWLSDDLRLRDGATLAIGQAGAIGFSNRATGQAPTNTGFEATLCGGLRLTVQQGGRLEVGSAATANTATARLTNGGLLEMQSGCRTLVAAGAQLVIGSGATLLVRNGATLEVNGRLRVDPGGFICVEPGANLVFAATAELSVDAGATLGVPAALAGVVGVPNCASPILACAQLTGGNPNVGSAAAQNEALAFDGEDDQVVAPVNGSPAFGLATEFTVEALIRSTRAFVDGAPQTILANRQGSQGLLFTLFGNGDLLLQLSGMNYGYQQAGTNIPLDGRCHHVAVTRDAAGLVRFYVDGVAAAYTTVTQRAAGSAGPLYVGAAPGM